MKDIWTYYKVTWLFMTKLCASVPADPEIVKKWIDARKPTVKPPGGPTIAEIQQEVLDTLAEPLAEPEYSMLVFQKFDNALVVRAATIKAHIKDCARQVSTLLIGKIEGEKAYSSRLINGCYVDKAQYWIPIMRVDGTPITVADGEYDKPIHARGPRGISINALKRLQYVNDARLDFTLKVLGKSVKLEDLEVLFSYGGDHGYAGERSDGEGRYDYTIEEVKQ